MPHDVIMPKIGMYLEDIRLVEWLVAEGAEVSAGEPLFTLETDKITSDVEAEAAGFLHRRVEENALVAIGTVVGAIAESRAEYEAIAAAAPAEAVEAFAPAQSELFLGAIRAGEATGAPAAPSASAPAAGTRTRRADGRLVSPRARALIAQAGLAPEAVEAIPATGPGGRVTDRDVQAYLDAGGGLEAAGAARDDLAVAERIPLRGRRRLIAKRMLESLQGAAQLTSILEIDVTPVVDWRRAAAASPPGYTAIFVALAARALRRHPILNARLAGEEIEVLADVNVGFAAHTEDGVIVPVVRGADRLALPDVEAAVRGLSERARAGTLTMADVEGATFTLSNSGTARVDITTAILNPPQAAILWLGRVRERAVAVDGAVAVRPTIQACLTFDHRILDGVPAADFLGTLEELVAAFPGSIGG